MRRGGEFSTKVYQIITRIYSFPNLETTPNTKGFISILNSSQIYFCHANVKKFTSPFFLQNHVLHKPL